MLANIDGGLAEDRRGARRLAIPSAEPPLNRSIPADGDLEHFEPSRA